MNLISKLCDLFVLWVIFGWIAVMTQTIVWRIRLSKVNHPDSDELTLELLNSFPGRTYNIRKEDSIKDTARKIEDKNGESIWILVFRGCVEWPKTMAILKLMTDEAYDYAVNKYGLKESRKSAS